MNSGTFGLPALSDKLFDNVCKNFYLPVCLSVKLSVCLSVCLQHRSSVYKSTVAKIPKKALNLSSHFFQLLESKLWPVALNHIQLSKLICYRVIHDITDTYNSNSSSRGQSRVQPLYLEAIEITKYLSVLFCSL